MSGVTQDPVSGRGAGTDTDSTATNGSNESRRVCREEAFEVLSNARRRHVIHHLLQQEDGQVTLRTLSQQVAAWENDIQPAAVSSKQRKRVYTALHQSHLPKLDDKELVRYDSDRGTVDATDRLTELKVYLEVVPAEEIPWSVYYLGIGLLSGLVTLLAWFEVFPIGALPDLLWGGLTAVLLVFSSIIHAVVTERNELGTAGPPPELRS